VNVNFPSAAVGPLLGLALTHQGTGCVFPKFLEVTEPKGPHLAGGQMSGVEGGGVKCWCKWECYMSGADVLGALIACCFGC
jgi:hypothetical protein